MSIWIRILRPQRDPAIRLLCIPFAGGGASAFARWSALLPEEIEVAAVELPGRETRHREPFASNVTEIVATLSKAVDDWGDRRWAIYGHSMGGHIGYRLAAYRHRVGLSLPSHLFIGACMPPMERSKIMRAFNESDERLISRMIELGGIAPAVAADVGFMSYLLPILRSDLRILSESHITSCTLLPIRVTCIAGSEDENAPAERMRCWQAYVGTQIQLSEIHGGHFFINSNAKTLSRVIAEVLHF